jgi:hypothetical protein
MANTFCPAEEITMYCRFCNKILPAQLDRSIAGNGKTLDLDSTFEYYCSKCFKTFCFKGHDLIPKPDEETDEESGETREYSPAGHFLIGETIRHKKLKDTGIVVGKKHGSTSKLMVQFKKGGLKTLVEDIE